MSQLGPSFYDLPADQRAAAVAAAEEATGESFYDLPPEERAYWCNRALGFDD